jgi:hypothetical protein
MAEKEDRLADGYEPRWDIDYELGRQGELWCSDIIDALKNGSVEIKTDEKALQTGRIYIEHECKGKPSCIAISKAEIWGYKIGPVTIFAPISSWRKAHAKALREGRLRSCSRGSHPTKGVVIPISLLIFWLQDL